jgi:LmbE family N-acetylglucosaminyl deacetylase
MIALTLPPGDLEVLCVGAHPDDIEIGCGATLLALAATRSVWASAVVLTGSGQRRDEALKATGRFLPGATVEVEVTGLSDGHLPSQWGEAKDALEAVARRVRPDVVFAPRIDDSHQDHRLVAELVPTVWRDVLVLGYEIPKWDGDLGRATHYGPVSTEIARRKIALLAECFPSQTDRDWWDDETFLAMLRLRGIECRSRYAEAFTAAKVVLAP